MIHYVPSKKRKAFEYTPWQFVESIEINDLSVLLAIAKFPGYINSIEYNEKDLRELNYDPVAINNKPINKKIRDLCSRGLIKWNGKRWFITWKGQLYRIYRNVGLTFWLLVLGIVVSMGIIKINCNNVQQNKSKSGATKPIQKTTFDSNLHHQKK